MSNNDAVARRLDKLGIVPVFRADKVDGHDVASITLDQAGTLLDRFDPDRGADVVNAVETLEAAITKLEKLRAESTQSEWFINSTWADLGLESGERAVVFDGYEPTDAALIVTLHRTIDPVLRVLEEGKREWYRSSIYPTDVAKAAITLAESILGDS